MAKQTILCPFPIKKYKSYTLGKTALFPNNLNLNFFLCSFGLTQKNQKVKTQQSSYRTRPDAGPLLRQPPPAYPICV
jgi:hypothetical protein